MSNAKCDLFPKHLNKFSFFKTKTQMMTEQEKQFYAAQRYFWALQEKLRKYRMSGQNPPEYLLKNYEDAKRTMNYYSEMLE